MPVLEQGRLVAVFFVNHGNKRNWSDGDFALIKEFAERTRSAVERARGVHALRESEARLRELNATLEAQVEARSAERDRLWNLSPRLAGTRRLQRNDVGGQSRLDAGTRLERT